MDLECESESTGNRGYIQILKTKKMALTNLLDTKVQGALVRSWFQNIKEMDAPSSYFFGLEKRRGQRRQIHSLLSETGQELTELSSFTPHCLKANLERMKSCWKRSVLDFLS